MAAFLEYPLFLKTDVGTFVRPSMHKEMLLDEARVNAFRRAIEECVEPGMHVLEIGAGSGVLSLLALRAGARHVTAIEASALAQPLRDIAAANGVSDRLTVVQELSYDVELDSPADLLITETLGHIGIDEGVLTTAADARRLVTAEAPMLPGSIRIFATPVFCPAFTREVVGFWQSKPQGFDMEAVLAPVFDTSYLTSTGNCEQLHARAQLFEIDLREVPSLPLRTRLEFDNCRKGVLTGFLLDFDCQVSPGVRLDGADTFTWHAVFLPIREPLDVETAGSIELELELSGASAAVLSQWSGGTESQEFAGLSRNPNS